MRHLGNLENSEATEVKHKTPEKKPDIPKEQDRHKLEAATKKAEPISSSLVKNMNDRGKIAYYRKHGLENLAANREALMRNADAKAGKSRLTKLSSKNLDKLSEARGLKQEDAKNLKESFAKWSPEARGKDAVNPELRNHSVFARHAQKGEKGVATHSSAARSISPNGDW